MNKYQWEYLESDRTWLTGSENDGGGVFEENGKWTGNVVYHSHTSGITYFNTREEAQKAVETELDFIRKNRG